MLKADYQIKYKNEDSEIEVQGDKDFVKSKFNELLKLKKPSSRKQINSAEDTKRGGPAR